MEEKISETQVFRKGAFTEESGKAFLLGNRCRSCGRVFYPARPFCFECFEKDMYEVRLGNHGILYSYTVCHMPSLHFSPPYTVGWIDIDEGIRVFAPIKEGQAEAIEIGMEMRLVLDALWEDEGRRVMGYKYRPITPQT